MVHWAPIRRTHECAPLHRVLSARRGSARPIPTVLVSGEGATGHLLALGGRGTGRVTERIGPEWAAGMPQPLPPLDAAPFTRRIDTAWRRTSYSGLTRAVHEAEHRPGGFRDDEPDEVLEQPAPPQVEGLVSPFADMPAGAAFGTLVHHVLEAVETDGDLEAELATRCREQLTAFPVADVTAEALTDALLPAMRTPLGPLAGDVSLADIGGGDRLAELDFELPMGALGAATLSDLAALLRRHLPGTDPLADYADRLDSPGLAESTLVGYLSGSIDVVLRIPGDQPRFLVVDYKTNLLRDPARPGIERVVRGIPPAPAGHGDDGRALPTAGSAVQRRAAPLPAVAPAGLRPVGPPRRGAVPVPARNGGTGHARRVRRVLVAPPG